MSKPPPFTMIGLTGLANAGKDTAAAVLCQHLGAHSMAFADALRDEVSEAFGIERAHLTLRESKEVPTRALRLESCADNAFVARIVNHYAAGAADGGVEGEQLDLAAPRSPRQIMQWWGTEYRRANDRFYWIKKASQRVYRAIDTLHPRVIVMTDVRFENEAALVRRFSGQLWQVVRPGSAPTTSSTTQAHASEVTGAAFGLSAVIDNSGDLLHLQEQVLSAWAGGQNRMPRRTVQVHA